MEVLLPFLLVAQTSSARGSAPLVLDAMESFVTLLVPLSMVMLQKLVENFVWRKDLRVVFSGRSSHITEDILVILFSQFVPVQVRAIVVASIVSSMVEDTKCYRGPVHV
jgi:hypothetical protein